MRSKYPQTLFLQTAKKLAPVLTLLQPFSKEISLISNVMGSQAAWKFLPIQALPSKFVPLSLVGLALDVGSQVRGEG